MSLKDIEKLKEKVGRDPNSKLFVPLAEEYRKEGMLDDAISVLLAGIERQPGYMSARVSLGKIYLEKGLMKEARSEFENVIGVIPDNLYAQKKLAEIYKSLGETRLAIKTYKTVLKLNAMDDEALSCLQDMEGGPEPSDEEAPEEEDRLGSSSPVETAEAGAPEETLEKPVSFEAETDKEPFKELTDATHPEEEPAEAAATEETPLEVRPAEEDVDSFKDSLFGSGSTAGENVLPVKEIHGESIEVVAEPEETTFEVEEDISFEDINEVLMTEEMPPTAGRAAGAPREIAEELGGTGTSAEAREDIAAQGFTDADRLIEEGNYSGALATYRKMLAADPANRKTLQRVEELRALLRLMGKDKEALIAKLNGFLEGIKERRDEFFGSS